MQIETDRLILREWKPDDFEPFAAMSADADVTRFLTVDGKPLSRYGAWQGFCANIGHWQVRGFGMFAVVDRDC